MSIAICPKHEERLTALKVENPKGFIAKDGDKDKDSDDDDDVPVVGIIIGTLVGIIILTPIGIYICKKRNEDKTF